MPRASLASSRPICAAAPSGSVRPSTQSRRGRSPVGRRPIGIERGVTAPSSRSAASRNWPLTNGTPPCRVPRGRRRSSENASTSWPSCPSCPIRATCCVRATSRSMDPCRCVSANAGHDGCTLTLKSGRGAVRTELEFPITFEQFTVAWEQTGGRRIRKTRHRLAIDDHEVDLDVFHDDLKGLLLAEVEFESDASMASFKPPAWFGPDVTDDITYTNVSLAVNAAAGPADQQAGGLTGGSETTRFRPAVTVARRTPRRGRVSPLRRPCCRKSDGTRTRHITLAALSFCMPWRSRATTAVRSSNP